MSQRLSLPRAIGAAIAMCATATAASLSVVAGWQRGGWPIERLLWIAIGIVLVAGAHLLPALCRAHGWRIRIVGAALWFGCMAATCFGHATFFLLAQQHAGEARAAAVIEPVGTGRGLSVIAAERATVIARLARATERRCGDRCASTRIELATLAARREALDAEATDVKRAAADQDRAIAAHDSTRIDPTSRALSSFGVSAAQVEVASGLAFAGLLEGLACFCWLLVLRPGAVTPVTDGVTTTTAAQRSHASPVAPVSLMGNAAAPVKHPVTALAAEANPPIQSPGGGRGDDVARVTKAIAAGELRTTVTEIRKFLGCSQARAAEVRKQLAFETVQS